MRVCVWGGGRGWFKRISQTPSGSATATNFHPYILYLQEMFAPGILYFTCAVVAAIGVIALFFMPETRGVKLTDKLNQTIVVEEPDEPKSRAV